MATQEPFVSFKRDALRAHAASWHGPGRGRYCELNNAIRDTRGEAWSPSQRGYDRQPCGCDVELALRIAP